LIAQSREALVVHVDGIIMAASPAAQSLLGCSADGVIGRQIYSFVAPASLARAKSRRRAAIAGGWPQPDQLSLYAAGGGTIEVEIASCPITWDDQGASQMTLRPIADVIADAVRLGAEAVAASDQAVIVTDPGNRIVNWNAGAAALYGWSTLDALGHMLDELVPWVGPDDDVQLVQQVIERDGAWQGVAHRLARDGHVVSVRSTTRAVRDGSGTLTAFVSVNEPAADLGEVDQLLTDVAAGLLRDEFEVWYQPIVRPATGAMAKVEALVRWRHPKDGLLLPAAFLPTVERSPLIIDLDDHVLRAACLQVAAWRAGSAPDLELAVNLSVHDLADDRLASRVADALAVSCLPAHALWLEVTETALAHNTDGAVAALHRLRDLGVRLSLDDFGTGFAHLVQLRRFPVQAVKIDRGFVTGMATDASDAAIVRSVISLGRELGLTVVAEGVETQAERDKLVELGCDLAQGSLFGTPAPAHELRIAVAPPLHRTKNAEPTSPELERLAALRSCGVLDTPAEAVFDRIVALASRLCDAPISLVCLLDEHRQWFKARFGVDAEETPRAWAFCDHVVASRARLVVTDTFADPRFVDNPLVVGEPHVRAYAGVPLVLDGGHAIGTLCVVDRQPRSFTETQLADLETLAAQVTSQLELRRSVARTDAMARGIEGATRRNEEQARFLDAVLDSSPSIIGRVTPDGLIETISEGVRHALGIDPASCVGRSALDLVHPDDVPTCLRSMAGAAATTGLGKPGLLRLRHAEGHWVPFTLMANTIEGDDGQRRIVVTATLLQSGAKPSSTTRAVA
jgi:PAS domain S-box-containing protein